MPIHTVYARAKLNLTLDVLGKRPDGYHDLKMVMQSVALSDCITLEPGVGALNLSTNLRFLPRDDTNLAARAAAAFERATGWDSGGLAIHIQKSIPVCAGMAGGSSDAAAVLRGLNALSGLGLSLGELARIGGEIGSDVPYCVWGGTALAEGRGEALTPLPSLPPCTLVLCKPGFSVSTPALFGRIDGQKIRRRPDTVGVIAALAAGDLAGVARRLYNVFEDALPTRQRKVVDEVKHTLIRRGALGAAMSGTGSTVYGFFDDPHQGAAACAELSAHYRDTFLTHPVGGEV